MTFSMIEDEMNPLNAMFGSAMRANIAEVLESYAKWGTALKVDGNELNNYIAMRMSFKVMKERKLKELRALLHQVNESHTWGCKSEGEVARRKVLEAFYAQVGHRLAFSPPLANQTDASTDASIRAALDRASNIEEMVTTYLAAKPMAPEFLKEKAGYEAEIVRIEALPDNGEFDLPEEGVHAQ